MKEIVASNPNRRFGLLASASDDGDIETESQATAPKLVVEELKRTNKDDGYDPARVGAQIEAMAGQASIDHLILECDSRTHPIAFASLFLPQADRLPGLSEVARLSSIVLSIDAGDLLGSIVHGSPVRGVTSPCILADQIEVASVIALKGDPASEDYSLSRAIASAINPRARIVERKDSALPKQLLDDAASFDFAAAGESAGWRKVIEEESAVEANDQEVTTFAYRARRPFHPERLWNLLQTRFPGVFRVKGYFWLATRMDLVGGLNIAGSECHYAPAGEWWAAVAHKDNSGHAEIPDRLKKVWMEPFGDRRQALAFMGTEMDPGDLAAKLDACLLSDAEMCDGEESWGALPDPFPAWSAHSHDHECEDHDCCHDH
jgi:G3E family GTPase